MKAKYIIFILFMTLIACKTEYPNINQRILFEKHYTNWAWSFQNNGYLIDSLGSVRTFDLSKDTIKWNEPDKDGYISLAEMNKNFSHCDSIIYQINTDTLSYYVGKIWAASKGKISEPVNQMADAGSITYSAFIFVEKTNCYKKVLIKTWGDWSIDNDSPEAEEIYQWMMRIGKKHK